MIWLTWRQFRVQAIVLSAALVVLAVLLAITGPHLAEIYRAHHDTFFERFNNEHFAKVLYFAGIVSVLAVPAIIGIFWGAPLITRELETGTYRLAWTQGVTRTRWLVTKLAFLGLAATTSAAVLSLMVTWWSTPLTRAATYGRAGDVPELHKTLTARMSQFAFSAHGITPIGYAAFAFALGVTTGVMLRRTVPTMAVTLAVFVTVQILVPIWVRPNLVMSTRLTTPITIENLHELTADGPDGPFHIAVTIGSPGAWILSNQTVDSAGRTINGLPSWITDCIGKPGPPGPADPQAQNKLAGAPGATQREQQACFAKLNGLGYRQTVTYHPLSRYWSLQWLETGLYFLLALALFAVCFWRTRRIS